MRLCAGLSWCGLVFQKQSGYVMPSDFLLRKWIFFRWSFIVEGKSLVSEKPLGQEDLQEQNSLIVEPSAIRVPML